MPWNDLISSNELAEHLHDSAWVIVDCRFDLAKPDWGFEEYQRMHIPGAVYAHLNNDLSSPKTPSTGRHPLPNQQMFFDTLSRWGIDSSKQVVVYDTSGGSFADRLWWMLRLYGHQAVAVLNGGLPQWIVEGRPVAVGIEHNPPAHFTGELRPEMMVSDEEVERIRQDPQWKLIDARADFRYRGEQEPLDPVAGHIPGAVNRVHTLNLDSNGLLKPEQQIRQEFDDLLQGIDPTHVVVYCGSGVTSIHHLLAMEHAGLKGAKLYVGSWSQWICDPNRPRALGNE